MIVFIYDTETTGFSETDRIVQHGVVVYDLVLNRSVDSRTWLCWESGFNVAESKKFHGWEAGTLEKYGMFPVLALRDLDSLYRKYKPVAVIAHNAEFDRRMLKQELARTVKLSPDDFGMILLPWLCTVKDAEYPGCPSKNLLTVTAFHGFLNPMAHDAIFDCFSLAKVIQIKSPGFVTDLARSAAEDYSIVFANIPLKFDEALNKKLKAKEFRWENLDGHFFEKCWIKLIKRSDFKDFNLECYAAFGYEVNIVKDIFAEDCYKSLLKTLEASPFSGEL